MQGGRRLDARHARHLDVEQGHVHVVRAGRRQHLVAAGHLDPYLDVGFQAEQRGEGLADHRLVLREEDADGT